MNKYLTLLLKTYSDIYKKHISKALVLAVLLLCVLSLSACSGFAVIKEDEKGAWNLPQPNPNDGIIYTSSVTLYYRLADTTFLIPYVTEIEMSSSEQPEAAILNALISGTGTGGLYSTLIPADTKLVNIVTSGDTMFVTLNNDFIEQNKRNANRRIAAYQIINTLSEYNGYSVQILIDKSDTGLGNRVSYAELGFNEVYDEELDYAAAFSFSKSYNATPAVLFEFALSSICSGNISIASKLFVSDNGTTTEISQLKSFLSEYEIVSYAIYGESKAQNYATVKCAITFKRLADSSIVEFDGLAYMIPSSNIYKASFTQFEEIAGKKS